MRLDAGQLAALAAVIREGSFERAARVLHVTPSAVSQRIRQLEELIGAILVVRASPCTASPVGEAFFRHALQVELLERDLIDSMAPNTEGSVQTMALSIAVNADSLATWLIPALQKFSAKTRVRVDVTAEDEAHTTELLRSGRVVGAVTSQARPVHGCRVEPLGLMRYLATASPRFNRRWFPDGCTPEALAGAPCLAYNRKDQACEQFLEQHLELGDVALRPNYVPSPNAYMEATLRSIAWGMNPEPLVASPIRRGRLVDLFPGRSLNIPLYWQQWSISSHSVDALAAALREHAGAVLAKSP